MNKQNLPAVPDENKIEELLGKIQPVPSEWFHERMRQSTWRTENLEVPVRSVSNQRLRLALAMTILLVFAGFLITPRGRAWAQNILLFFHRTESDILPLQPWQLTPFPTPTISAPTLSMATAEEQVGFDVRELIAVPEKLTLQGARVEENIMYIDYTSAEDCRFTLAQTLNHTYPNASLWSQFSAGDIQPVKIGAFAGEFVYDSSSTPSVMRLRWQQPDDGSPPPSDISFSNFRPGILSLELTEFCAPDSAGYVDAEGLLDLAQRTVHTNWVGSLVKLEQAEQQVGFSALQLPDDNPELFTLVGASVDPQYQLLMLIYHSPDGSGVQSGRSFTLEQWPITEPLETCDLCAAIGASAEVITISVRGTTGEYVQGVWSLTNIGPVWEPVPHRKIIRWQEDGYWFELGMFTVDGSHTMEDLIAVAESLK
jgi:hypothetical protein